MLRQHTTPVVYKDIPGLPGYRATSLGTVESCHHRRWGIIPGKWHILKGFRRDYLYVHPYANGRSIPRPVHLLVCEAFHGPRPFPEAQTRHLDGDNFNNRPENLRWGTKRENAADRDAHGRTVRGSRINTSRLSEADARAILSSGEKLVVLAHRYGVSISAVWFIRHRRNWKHL